MELPENINELPRKAKRIRKHIIPKMYNHNAMNNSQLWQDHETNQQVGDQTKKYQQSA